MKPGDCKLPPRFMEQWLERAEEWANEVFDTRDNPVIAATDSPIEGALLTAITLLFASFDVSVAYGRGAIARPFNLGERGVNIITQALISGYRADILILSQEFSEVKIVVECDGHDFHEKTKEQARRDKARDRKMALLGYTVIRFTGSEIYENAFDCASEVHSFYESEWLDALWLESR